MRSDREGQGSAPARQDSDEVEPITDGSDSLVSEPLPEGSLPPDTGLQHSDEEQEGGDLAPLQSRRSSGRGGRASHLAHAPSPLPACPGASSSRSAAPTPFELGGESDDGASDRSAPTATADSKQGDFKNAFEEPWLNAGAAVRSTMEVHMRVNKLEVCPIELVTMVEPVRIVHEGEEDPVLKNFVGTLKGPPHVVSREAAERWLSKDPLQRCPLCRRRVVGIMNDVKAEENLEDVVRGLVSEQFHGGDNLAHKAVKLLDPKLLCAIGRVLTLEETFTMLLQGNDDGYIPLSLLEVMHSKERMADFFEGLPQRKPELGAPELVYSPRSAIYGGSEVWCHDVPVYAGSQFEGQDGAVYTAVHVAGLEPMPPRRGYCGRLGGYAAEVPLARSSAGAAGKSAGGSPPAAAAAEDRPSAEAEEAPAPGSAEEQPQEAQAQPAEAQSAEPRPAGSQPAEAQPAEAQPVEAQPAEAQPAEPQTAEAQPAEAEPAEAQPAEAGPAEATPSEARPPEARSAEAQPAEALPPEARPPEAQSAEAQSAEAHPPEAESAAAKSAEARPAEAQTPEAQSSEAQPAEAQPPEAQPLDAQPAGAQSTEAQPPEAQPPEAQSSEPQPAESQSTEAQPPEAQSTESQPSEAQSTQAEPAEAQFTEGEPAEARPPEAQFREVREAWPAQAQPESAEATGAGPAAPASPSGGEAASPTSPPAGGLPAGVGEVLPPISSEPIPGVVPVPRYSVLMDEDGEEPEEGWPELPPFVAGSRSPGGKRGVGKDERWGTAVCLRNVADDYRARLELCALPVRYARMPRLDTGFDDEIYEPVIRIRVGRDPGKVFTGRLAARRGIWLGGTQHFDDCVLPGEPGAAALLLFEPATALWRLLPGSGPRLAVVPMAPGEEPPEATSTDEDLLPFLPSTPPEKEKPPQPQPERVPAEGMALRRLLATRCKLEGRDGFVLEPGFAARRYSELAGLPEESVAPALARRMRERVVLLFMETEIMALMPLAGNTVYPKTISRSTELGAVLTDFSIGRGESCHMRFPEVLSVSRSHCILELQEEGGSGRIVAYDDGSLVGTQVQGQGALGAGRESARELKEGDALQLGLEVIVRLRAISPVLNLDDTQGLANFFERVGGRRTARSLRQEPRLTERIVSHSLTAGNIRVSSGPDGDSVALDSLLDELDVDEP